MKVKVDNFGRLLIPKNIRQHMGLKPGTIVILKERNNHLLIKLHSEEPPIIKENGLLIFTGEAVGDLKSTIEEDRQARDKKIGGF